VIHTSLSLRFLIAKTDDHAGDQSDSSNKKSAGKPGRKPGQKKNNESSKDADQETEGRHPQIRKLMLTKALRFVQVQVMTTTSKMQANHQ
jgi:hypothetical protein